MSKHYAVFRFLAVAVCALWFVGSQAQATTFTVSKLADTNDGTCNIDCSLREAIAAANDIAGNDVISFDTTIFNTAKTISLSSGFTLVEDVTINGPTVGISIVGKGNASIIFIVNQGVSAKFTRLTLLTSYSGIINYGTTIGTDCVMSGNSYGAKNRGTLTFINSTFTNNSDGIENEGTVILRGCTLEGNRFTAIENYGTLSCSNSSLSRNNAASNISAVYNGGPANFTNCTISNNEYGLYNMVDFSKAAFTITNCTMSGNKIGLFNQGMATLSNSLVVGNVENISGSFTDGGGNITTGTAAQAGLETSDGVNAVVLKNNGGLTQTIALLADSPALDQGSPGGAPYDQRGFTRYDNPAIPNTNGDSRDIGAFELQSPLSDLSINNVSASEGNSSSTALSFTVSLSATSAQPVTVQYATANGTGVAGSDYTAQSGTLTIPAGQMSGTIPVPVISDTVAESNDTLLVNLANPINATISDNQGIGTIINDDAGPGLSINDATITEGNSGTVNAAFTVTLSAASNQTVTVSAITSNGSARSPGDYTATGVRLTFAPGETRKTVSVPVKGDLLDEINETFFVILSSSNNAVLARGRGLGTITDNDAAPTVSIDNISIGEGNSGQRSATLRLRLSAPSGQAVRISYATTNGTTNPATAGSDYIAVAPTSVAFNTGSLYAYARVLINGDLLNESNETFLVNLSSPLNATIADTQATGTILNDDSAPALTINDVSIAEGNTGTKNLTFTVTLSKASGQTVTVNYATANGIARSGSDYEAKNGVLRFIPDTGLTRQISIPIYGETLVEGDETFYILFSSAANASIGRGRGGGVIIDDDASDGG